MNIGKAIKDLRKLKGLTQGQMAKKAKITQTALSKIEKGKTRPGEITIQNLANALNVTEAYFYITALEIEDLPPGNTEVKATIFPIVKLLLEKLIS